MPLLSFDDLMSCLAIESLGDDRYTAPNIPMPYHRIFGGQLLAQCIAIADLSAEGKGVKSLHVAFPREGDLRKPVEYHLERVQDGRTFASRWIVGRQSDRVICTASVSLHSEETGISHQIQAPETGAPSDAAECELSMIPWETRSVGGVDLEDREVGPPRYELWMRCPALPDAPVIHQALLAYSTDLSLIGTALRPHRDLSEADSPERIHTAVTTHTFWFHRSFRSDDWLLLCQESPSTAGARGFGTGHVFTAGGELVGSFAQESMIRGTGG